ncbi:MAG: T6SS immunity protein Tli4 family protein, partial [Pseudomonadota bacterium]
PKGDWFFLKHGAINLPYLWQEKSYVRFEGHPLNLKIEIDMDMDAGHKRPQFGLIEKASAAIDSGYASAANVSIKNIRSQKREVAGVPGEEVIDRLTDKDNKTLDFGWEYVGKKDSGEYPTMRITMESPDGNLDEKLKIWDAVLDSMKPMFERKN